jgi:hypothetical protein
MTSSAHRLAAVIAAVAVIALANGATANAADIGTATAITTAVTGTMNTAALILKSGDAVYQNEVITTDAEGVGQFEFRDETKLAVGPGSTVVLDNFVYDSDTSKAKVVINLTQGAFRFITGKSDHTAYEIVTPTATIGVRGTAFDVYTKDDGELAVAMINGAVEVCPRGGLCRVHNVVGEFLHMTPFGDFSLRKTWDGTFLKGVPFKIALPFLNDQNSLIPALRGSTSTVGRYLKAAGNDIGKVIKLPLTKFPKLKLPHLFK